MAKKLIFKKKRLTIDGKEQTVIKPMSYRISDEALREKSDFETKYGRINGNDLSAIGKIKTSQDKDAYLVEERLIDKYNRIKKAAQTIPLKDIGFIITETGMNKDSVVGEAGCGSGGVSCFIAHFVKQIYSYDINDKHLDIINQNISDLGIKNISVEKHDIYKDALDVADEFFDVFVLDLPEPIHGFKTVISKVKIGGFIVVYCPNITQNLEFVNSLTTDEKAFEKANIIHTIEILERIWDVHGRIAKPVDWELGHSGYLTFLRRVS